MSSSLLIHSIIFLYIMLFSLLFLNLYVRKEQNSFNFIHSIEIQSNIRQERNLTFSEKIYLMLFIYLSIFFNLWSLCRKDVWYPNKRVYSLWDYLKIINSLQVYSEMKYSKIPLRDADEHWNLNLLHWMLNQFCSFSHDFIYYSCYFIITSFILPANKIWTNQIRIEKPSNKL